MTDPADPADLTPPGNPADYAKPFRPSASFWAMMALCVLCVLAGWSVRAFGPTLWPVKAPEKPAAPAPAAAPAVPADTDQAPSEVNLSGGPAVATPSAEVTALSGRISALEAIQARTADAAVASLAASTLADASRNSGPFDTTSLAVLERMMPMSPDLQALRDLARTGAPSRAALAADFDAAARTAAVASRDPGERGGLLARVKFALASIITIRRTSETGSGTDAILARAERQVGEGNLEGALRTLAALPPKPADAMAAWREKAQRRVELDRRVAAIRGQALADLMAASRARPPYPGSGAP